MKDTARQRVKRTEVNTGSSQCFGPAGLARVEGDVLEIFSLQEGHFEHGRASVGATSMVAWSVWNSTIVDMYQVL